MLDSIYIPLARTAALLALFGPVLAAVTGPGVHAVVSVVFSLALLIVAYIALDPQRSLRPFLLVAAAWVVEASLEWSGVVSLETIADFDYARNFLTIGAIVVAVVVIRAIAGLVNYALESIFLDGDGHAS